MAFHLYSSNRLEALAAALAEVTGRDPLPPLTPEIVVVQSGGMARWLSHRLAEAQGICANLDCPFPNDLVERVCRLLLPEMVTQPGFERKVLPWQLWRILPELTARPEFAPLAAYLADGDELKRSQLAGRLADRFDQYLIFRPEMVLAWEAGEDDHWQARLWRELRRRPDGLAGVVHRAQLREELLARLAEADLHTPGLPARFSVFGLSSLPPYHLQIFNGLARHLDLHFFFFAPSREYWGDIRSEQAIGRLSRDLSPEELHLATGNPLLASWGQQGQELFRMLQECQVDGEYDLFVDPLATGKPGRLPLLQSDILELQGSDKDNAWPETVAPDLSLQVHACASPRRELEVLHDQLLALFEKIPDLEPREIVVMVPDIEVYSPLVPAVFGTIGGGQPRIPYSIADRKMKNEGELVGAFLSLLALRGSRLELARVLALLEQPPVRARFGLGTGDLERIEGWLLAVNVRWGIDEHHRAGLGLPATHENSWRFGLERLLLGYAMSEKNGPFGEILPYDGMEGSESEALGRFLDFVETLFAGVEQLAGSRSLGDWGELLGGLLRALLAPTPEQEQEWRFLQESVANLARLESAAGLAGEMGLPVVAAHLEELYRGESMTGGFLAGRVTFCELLPMRAVPFRVVCLLGMNDGDYPRSAPQPSFDLIGSAPRPGDRSRRKDDRYLFLEGLLSAREVFYLSYLGQSVRDGATLLPSVLISELLEYLEKRQPGSRSPVLLHHPLQPFSPDYFGGRPELFSFSEGNWRAASALTRPKNQQVLVPTPLPEPAGDLRRLTLSELVEFFRSPARYFCLHRLGLQLVRESGELPDSENFTLAGLERFQLGEGLLTGRLSGTDKAQAALVAARLSGVLPHGSVGRSAYTRLAQEVAAVAAGLPELAGLAATPLAGEVQIGEFVLSGRIERYVGHGQIRCRFAQVGAKDLSAAWLHHLFFQVVAAEGEEAVTTLAGADALYSFAPLPEATAILAGLLDLYWQGLRCPLPFFPETSLKYQELLRKGKTPREAMDQALRQWEGSEYGGRGEADDPYLQLCYRGLTPLDETFAGLAGLFWTPLLENRHG